MKMYHNLLEDIQARRNLDIYTVIVVGIIVTLLSAFGFVPQGAVLSVILTAVAVLLISLATIIGHLSDESVKRTKQFDELKHSISENTESILASLQGVKVQRFSSTEDGTRYLCKRYDEAKFTIDQASLAPSLVLSEPHLFPLFEEACCRAVQNPNVSFRYVNTIAKNRLQMIKRFFQLTETRKYFVRYYSEQNDTIPLSLSFTVIDDEELILRFPYDQSEPGYWLSIRQPYIVDLFKSYYAYIWRNAKRLDRNDTKTMQDLDQLFDQN